MKTKTPRTAAASRARSAAALRRRIRAAAALLRANGYNVEPQNLDAALLLKDES